MYINGSDGEHHGGCEVRRMNPKMGQRHASTDAGWNNFIGQQSGSNSSVWKLQLLINKSGIYWREEKKNRQGKISMTLIQIVYANHITLREGKQGTNSADFGAPAPGFEKSAWDFKPKSKLKLLKCKNTVNINPFNVRSLNSVNQLPDSVCSWAW